MNIEVLNGPNLNRLGTREPDIYGTDTLADIEQRCRQLGRRLGLAVTCRQSNHEGELVTWIQQATASADALIINAGAYTHTSIAIHDALRAYDGFALELHISNPHQREQFRHRSYIAPAVDAVILGLGVAGYTQAITTVAAVLNTRQPR